MSLDAERLRELMHYDPETGVFTRLVRTSNRVKVGDVAGSLSHYGYLEFQLYGKLRKAHRLAWLYMTGEWPTGEIDHRNTVRTDNRFCNLRDVTTLGNQQNRRSANKNSLTGFLGVSPKRGKWKAQIRAGGVLRHLGTFETPTAAHQAYLQAKRKLHEGCTI